MFVPQDALELLLPELDEDARARVRRVTSFLRLLVDDARSAQAQCVGVDLLSARRELELQSRGQVEATLRDLLRHHLEAAVPADSFFWFGEPATEVQRCWSSLEELRNRHDALPNVPGPGESALSVAARLVEGLEAVGASAHECAMWRARWRRFAEGPRAAEVDFKRAIDAAVACGSVPRLRSALAGAAEALLDRGAVREARQLLLDHLTRAGATARLRQLLAWSRLALDDAAGARSVLVGVKPWTGPLPASLVELRERRREWLPMLTGWPRRPPPALVSGVDSGPEARLELDRAALGASVLALFAFRRGQGAVCLAHDVAPALRDRFEAWIAECEGAASVPESLHHQLLVEARTTCRSLDGASERLGVLGDEATRSVFLEPLFDDVGEVAGWLHAELEHHLVPAAPSRQALARRWRARVLRESARVAPSRHCADAEGHVESTAGPCATHFEALVDQLGIKTAQRLWWGFSVHGDELEPVANGGLGQGFSDARPGLKKALERSLSAGGPVLFEAADERLSVHGGSCSGIVLPLRFCGKASALLVIESCRRRDFKASDLQRLQVSVDRAALTHRVAQFRRWHLLRFGHDVWFDTHRADFEEFARRLVLAARNVDVLAFTGPNGVGKQVLARWAHFEGPRASRPLDVLGPGRLQSASALEASLERVRGGTLVIEDADRLSPELQEDLLRRIEGSGPSSAGVNPVDAPALHLFFKSPLEAAASAGSLRSDLARCLDRMQLRVPSLRERREDILPLIDCFARRFATELHARPPSFADEALALLWRQAWPGNVRELENLVFKLVLFSRDAGPASRAELALTDVLRIARQNHVELVRRLPSRHPRRADLIAALRTTCTLGGRTNKSRAALYLGWDPDTLASRLDDAEISDDELAEQGWRPDADGDLTGAAPSATPMPEDTLAS